MAGDEDTCHVSAQPPGVHQGFAVAVAAGDRRVGRCRAPPRRPPWRSPRPRRARSWIAGSVMMPLPQLASWRVASNCSLTRSTGPRRDGRRRRAPGRTGEPQGDDEGQVGDDDVDRSADVVGSQVAHVEALDHRDPIVAADAFVELAVADVDSDHVGGAALQQAVGEPARGGAGVKGPATLRRCGRRRERKPPRLTYLGGGPSTTATSPGSAWRRRLVRSRPVDQRDRPRLAGRLGAAQPGRSARARHRAGDVAHQRQCRALVLAANTRGPVPPALRRGLRGGGLLRRRSLLRTRLLRRRSLLARRPSSPAQPSSPEASPGGGSGAASAARAGHQRAQHLLDTMLHVVGARRRLLQLPR